MIAAAALALVLPGGTGPDARPKPPAYSLVAGEWGGAALVDEDACPGAGESGLCLDVVGDLRVRGMLTLSGPTVRPDTALRVAFHVPPRRHARIVLLVYPAAEGRPRRATILTAVRAGESACIARSLLEETRLTEPVDSRRAGDEVCFRV